jgi:hypothetical protein
LDLDLLAARLPTEH